jgi:SAM-dependent methyltransferase
LDIVDGVVTRSPGPFIGAALISIVAGLGWYASRRGKFVVWDRLLDQLNLRGDERLLDMGCGRGAVLLMAAQRLTTGRAVGVDLWRVRDQSGNAADATERNARTEGVADRVELHTADMTALPFEPDTFDLVLSNIAIHNIKGLPAAMPSPATHGRSSPDASSPAVWFGSPPSVISVTSSSSRSADSCGDRT